MKEALLTVVKEVQAFLRRNVDSLDGKLGEKKKIQDAHICLF